MSWEYPCADCMHYYRDPPVMRCRLGRDTIRALFEGTCDGRAPRAERPYESHRCEGSLANRCSMRRYSSTDALGYDRMRWAAGDGRWHLWALDYSFEHECDYMHHIGAIRYCPYCGARLEG